MVANLQGKSNGIDWQELVEELLEVDLDVLDVGIDDGDDMVSHSPPCLLFNMKHY